MASLTQALEMIRLLTGENASLKKEGRLLKEAFAIYQQVDSVVVKS